MEVNEILEKILPGFEPTDKTTVEDVMAELGKKYVAKDYHDKVVRDKDGKASGTIATTWNKALKGLGVDQSEYKDLSVDEQVALFESKIKGFNDEIESLKSGTPNDEKLKDLEQKVKDMTKIIKAKEDEVKTAKDIAEAAAKEKESEISSFYMKNRAEKIFNSAPWADKGDEKLNHLVKEGVRSKYLTQVIFKADGDVKDEKTKLLVYSQGKDGADPELLMDGANPMIAEKYIENCLKAEGCFKENKGNPKPPKSNDSVELPKGVSDYQKTVLEKRGIKVEE